LAFCTGFARNEFGLLTIIRVRIAIGIVFEYCIGIIPRVK